MSPHREFKKDDPPRSFGARTLAPSVRPRVPKVAPNIEQNQVADLILAEREMVSAFNAIQPRIRENVSGNALRHVLLNIAHARSEFHCKTGVSRIHPARDLTIKL